MFDPRVFNYNPHDLIHRNGFDLSTGSRLGLIREIVLRFCDDDDGNVTPFITIRFLSGEGYEREVAYEADEVGFIDIGTPLTASELLAHLNGFRDDLNFYEQLLGPNHDDTKDKREEYEKLIQDVGTIMCANNFFTSHCYQSLLAQHYLSGLG